MAIEYITKDLTTVTHGVVAHGCNCQGKMGAGIAKDIRHRWPAAYYEYIDLINTVHPLQRDTLLGKSQMVKVEESPISTVYVANWFTQLHYGRENKRYADPDAIRHAMANCLTMCASKELPLYMPKVGCSLGGLDWDIDVHPLIQHLSDKVGDLVTIYVCTK